ncbi:PilZ domain-containing protein [Novosphingobium sp. SL115]|uniref:PilZ domain-containing protein n=1 Tax=Novosphingobium sp. SL115 TaxID=2995150 RepID=UPI0022735AD2|nr:PilZ domain-containing protein [Novosphingobium sp. SL115]MCY1670830.1 PilZ domain-containing protein [Novosphingobium sp. SL115]
MATAEPSVTGIDHRQLGRDSLLLMAEVRLAGSGDDNVSGEHRVKVRNLSAGGMMAEGPMKVARGTQVEVNLRNIGWIEGAVAWIQDNRFGIAFINEIDPKLARAPVGQGESTPRFVKPPIAHYATGPMRKI